MSSGCQPKRSASMFASSAVGASRWIQVRPPAWSSARRGSARGDVSATAERGRVRLMRGRLGIGTEGVVHTRRHLRHPTPKGLRLDLFERVPVVAESGEVPALRAAATYGP